jgi:hypothetical protein
MIFESWIPTHIGSSKCSRISGDWDTKPFTPQIFLWRPQVCTRSVNSETDIFGECRVCLSWDAKTLACVFKKLISTSAALQLRNGEGNIRRLGASPGYCDGTVASANGDDGGCQVTTQFPKRDDKNLRSPVGRARIPPSTGTDNQQLAFTERRDVTET